MTALMQQQIDASNKDAAALTALQHSLDQKLSDQQVKLVAPIASLGTKVDEMSGDFSAVRENVRELVRRMNDMDGKLTDIASAVRTINNPVTPPAVVVPEAGAAQPVQAAGPPAGWSAELAYNTAYRDFGAKKDERPSTNSRNTSSTPRTARTRPTPSIISARSTIAARTMTAPSRLSTSCSTNILRIPKPRNRNT